MLVVDIRIWQKRVYSGENAIAKPDMCVFDSTCRIVHHVEANNCKCWESVGPPVDVFHFKSKYKEIDRSDVILHYSRTC
jgi:hypothetical protein